MEWFKKRWIDLAALVVACLWFLGPWASGVAAVVIGHPREAISLSVGYFALGAFVGWNCRTSTRIRGIRKIRKAFNLLPQTTKDLVTKAMEEGGIRVRYEDDDFVQTRMAVGAGLLVVTEEAEYYQALTVPVSVAQALKGTIV